MKKEMGGQLQDVYSQKLWQDKFNKLAEKQNIFDKAVTALSTNPRFDSDQRAYAQGFTNFKVNEDYYASYERANAIAETLMALGITVNFQGYSMITHKWLCFLYKTPAGDGNDTVKIDQAP